MNDTLTGTAIELLEEVRAHLPASTPARAHVAAYTLTAPLTSSADWWDELASIEAEVTRHIRATRPRTIVIVVESLDPEAEPHEVVSLTRSLVSEATRFALTSIGSHLTAIGVAVLDIDTRTRIASRIATHISGATAFGDGVVLTDRDLRRRSIRQLIGEELL